MDWACGCPVVTSDRAPMSQIAGPAALLANPGDIPAFATRIQQLLAESPELRRRRKVEARQHASHYNPESCLQSLLLVYGKLAGQTNGESL